MRGGGVGLIWNTIQCLPRGTEENPEYVTRCSRPVGRDLKPECQVPQPEG